MNIYNNEIKDFAGLIEGEDAKKAVEASNISSLSH